MGYRNEPDNYELHEKMCESGKSFLKYGHQYDKDGNQLSSSWKDMYRYYLGDQSMTNISYPCVKDDYAYVFEIDNVIKQRPGAFVQSGRRQGYWKPAGQLDDEERKIVEVTSGRNNGQWSYTYIDTPITGLKVGEEVSYVAQFHSKHDACTSGNSIQPYDILSTSGTLRINVETICTFDCQHKPDIGSNDNHCNAQGTLDSCGTCTCNDGYTGAKCDVPIAQDHVRSDRSCSGNGMWYLENGVGKCKCDNTINYLVYGNCCEYDESLCPRKFMKKKETNNDRLSISVCNGQGKCVGRENIDNEIEMVCNCNNGYTGHDC